MNCPLCKVDLQGDDNSSIYMAKAAIPKDSKTYTCPQCKTHYYNVDVNKLYLIRRPK